MIRYDSGSVSATVLNGLHAFDAVVNPNWGTASGNTYATITAALAAGASSIYVMEGSTAESVTVSTAGALIFAEGRGGAGAGARIKSMTISAERVTVMNLAAENSAAHAFVVSAGSYNSALINCFGYNAASQGFAVAANQSMLRFLNCQAQGCDNGFLVSDPASSEIMDDILFSGCRANGNDGNGFIIQAGGTGTSPLMNCNLDHCYSYGNAQAWSAHGFSIGPAVDVNLTGCRAYGNGSGAFTGNGFYVNAGTQRGVNLTGCWARGNNNAGFRLAAASTRVQMVGCHQNNNTTGFVNCASCNGYRLDGAYGTNGTI